MMVGPAIVISSRADLPSVHAYANRIGAARSLQSTQRTASDAQANARTSIALTLLDWAYAVMGGNHRHGFVEAHGLAPMSSGWVSGPGGFLDVGQQQCHCARWQQHSSFPSVALMLCGDQGSVCHVKRRHRTLDFRPWHDSGSFLIFCSGSAGRPWWHGP